MRLPKWRRPFLPSGTSMTAPGTLWYPGKCFESSANWFSPRLPASSGSGKLFAISCRQSTSKSAIAFACWTMRPGSTLPSTPRHHWTFQVMSFIETARSVGSLDSGAHERLHKLPLKQQKADQERRRRNERCRRDDRPVDALIGGGEHLQAD